MAKSVFSGKLSNGVPIEVLEAESFSGKTEFAIKVGGEVSSITQVNVIRSGDIQVKTSAKAVRIKSGQNQSAPSTPAKPTLGDVQ